MTPALVHRLILGDHAVTDVHAKLYDNYPKYRGFSQSEQAKDVFEATFVLAIMQTFGEGGKFHPSFLCVPATQFDWVNGQMKEIARALLLRWKFAQDVEQRKRVVERLSKAFQHLMIGSKVFQVPEAPRRWMAFGFSQEDPIPLWLKDSLLSV